MKHKPPTSWIRKTLLQEAIRALEAAGVDDARRNAEWIMEEALGAGRTALYAYPEQPVPPEQERAVAEMVARRCRREPLQYVIGHTDFYGLRLRVTPDVLIPRPETEQVVEVALAALDSRPAPRVLDVGTGSGCIPLAVKHVLPAAAVYGCDVSTAALGVARANAAALGLEVAFFEADVLADHFPAGAPGALDLLISNPPYVLPAESAAMEPEVRDHEPHLALFTTADALQFYRALAGHAPALLAPGGLAVFETHADHGAAVAALLRAQGFVNAEVRTDLAGRPRIAMGRWPGP